jgi:hypothetical protein
LVVISEKMTMNWTRMMVLMLTSWKKAPKGIRLAKDPMAIPESEEKCQRSPEA